MHCKTIRLYFFCPENGGEERARSGHSSAETRRDYFMRTKNKVKDGNLHYHKHYHNEDAKHDHSHRHYHPKSSSSSGKYYDDNDGNFKNDKGDDSNWSDDNSESYSYEYSDEEDDKEDDKKSLHIFIHKEKKDGENSSNQVTLIF